MQKYGAQFDKRFINSAVVNDDLYNSDYPKKHNVALNDEIYNKRLSIDKFRKSELNVDKSK